MTLPAPQPIKSRLYDGRPIYGPPIFDKGLTGQEMLDAFVAAHGEKGFFVAAEEAQADTKPEFTVTEEQKRSMFIHGIVETVTIDITNDWKKGCIAPGAWDSIPTMVGVIASRTAELTLNELKKSEVQGEA